MELLPNTAYLEKRCRACGRSELLELGAPRPSLSSNLSKKFRDLVRWDEVDAPGGRELHPVEPVRVFINHHKKFVGTTEYCHDEEIDV